MDELDLRAAKITYENIENDDVIEFRAWCLVYAEVLVATLEATQQELAEAEVAVDKLQERCTELVEEKVQRIYHRETTQVTTLRAQLAEAQAEAGR